MKHFILKSIIVFFISILVTVITGMISPKEVYYFINPSEPKREITKERYDYDAKYNGKQNVNKEEKYINQNSIIYGISTFAVLMMAGSIIELRKKQL